MKKRRFRWPALWRRRGRTVIEYLPDADEIERSPVPRGARLTLHVLLLAVAAFGVWAHFSQLDQVVVAQGRLVNPLPNVVVQPLETAVVQTIDVRVGQVVRKGEALARLDATFVQADETQLRQRLASLETQIRGFEQELSGVEVKQIVEDPNPGKKVYLPGHPDADQDGFVTFPNVNPVHETVNLLSASRGYEANASAVDTLKSMAQRALDIAR